VVAGTEPRPGGVVYHAARAYSRLEADVAVAASCAPGDRATLLSALEALGLDTSWHPSAVTATYAFHYVGDTRVMRQEAVGAPWSARDAVEAVGEARWVHVGGLVRSDFPVATLGALAGERSLLVDGQGLVRVPVLGPLQLDADVGDALQHVAILKLDAEEASILAGGLDPASLRGLGVPEVVVTLASSGSFVVTAELVEHAEADAVPGLVDPTGAGDMFAAAYLTARAGGAGPGEALRRSSAFASSVLAGGS
jgi:1D-myo-inositol 3-kinase